MAGKSAVTLRLGVEGDEKIQAALRKIGQTGDAAFAGLSKEAKEAARSFDRLEKSVDVQARSAAQVARAYVQANRAIAQGVRTQADAQRVVDLAAERHRRLTGAVNDNAKAAGLARHEWINLSRQFQDIGVSLAGGQSPLTVLFQQGSQVADIFGSSGAGAGAALRSFGATAARALFGPIGAATALAASIATVAFQAGRAQEELAKLSEQSRLTGLPADVLQGAKTIGAGAGLDEKGVLGAFGNAGKEFQSFGRNEGAVKSTLEKIDKGFLAVVDRARSAGEFIDILNDKIRSLPTAQAEQLAKALYSDEGGAKLADAIKRGEVSMRALVEASGSAGGSLNQSASAAEEMRNKIAQAAQEADNKLLNAFKNIKSPTDDIKISWYGIVGAMADAVEKSERLQRALNAMTSWTALFKEIGAAYDKVDRMLGARPIVSLENERRAHLAAPGDIPFPNFNDAKQGFLTKLINAPVGDTRNLFVPDPKKTGKSAAEKSAEKFTDIEASLKNQIALVAAEGAEHDKIALKIKIVNEQRRIGVGATKEQKDEVAGLVTQLDAAERVQKNLTKEAETYRDAMKEVGDVTKSFLHDLERGGSLGKALGNTLKSLQGKAIDKGVDAGIGALGNAFKSGSGGFFDSIGSSLKSLWPFADGGVMTSAGPLPLRRYAAGGIADSPQLAMFGEGRMPEAYVPLPDGRSIPVAMQGGGAQKVIIQNFAPGIDIQQQVTPQGVVLTVQSMLKDYSKQIPGILSDARRRGNR